MKKVLSMAVAAALAVPAIAMADSTIYGKVRVSEDKTSVDAKATEVSTGISGSGTGDSWGTNDHSSRVGIKGSEDLGNGLSAIYQMEFGVKVGESFSSMSGRNAFVGLAGDFGTFLVGRHDTPLKISTGKLDLFADTAGDSNYYGLTSDLRVDGAIAYVSPSFNGLTLAGAVVSHPVGTEDFMDAISLAGMYSNGPIYASLAYESHQSSDDANLNAALGTATTPYWSIASVLGDSGNDSQIRVGLGLMDWNNFTVTLVYEKRNGIGMVDGPGSADDDDGWDSDAYVLSGAFKFTPNDQIKAMYGNLSAEDANSGAIEEIDLDQWAIGYQHDLSNRTDVQVVYTAVDADNTDTLVDVNGTPVLFDLNAQTDVFSIQLNHKF